MPLNLFHQRDAYHFHVCVCRGSIFACPSGRTCAIDVKHKLISLVRTNTTCTLRTSLARVAFVCPGQDAVATQLTGANMRTVEAPSAAGTGLRRRLSRLYRMIEALETSPMESLFDRVLRLEQEVSELKRNSPIGYVAHE